jgi:hypothetical protein
MQKKRPNGRQLVALKNRIVSCFTESHWRELGALTETMDMINCHHRLLRSLSWKDSDYDGHALDIINRIIESSPENYGNSLRLCFREVSRAWGVCVS